MLTELLTNPLKKSVWLWISTSKKWSLSKTNPTSTVLTSEWFSVKKTPRNKYWNTLPGCSSFWPPLAPVTQPHPNGKPKIHRNRRACDPFQQKDWNPTQILRVFWCFFSIWKGSMSLSMSVSCDFLVDWLVCYLSCHVWIVFFCNLEDLEPCNLSWWLKKKTHKKQDLESSCDALGIPKSKVDPKASIVIESKKAKKHVQGVLTLHTKSSNSCLVFLDATVSDREKSQKFGNHKSPVAEGDYFNHEKFISVGKHDIFVRKWWKKGSTSTYLINLCA